MIVIGQGNRGENGRGYLAAYTADTGKLIAAGWRPAHDTSGGLTAMVQAAAPRKSGTASRSTR